MRIIHTEWSDGMGGQEKRVLAECKGLAERGHYVELACREHSRIKIEAERLGIRVHILPFRRLYDVASMISLYRIIKRGRFDVVNTHSGVDSWIGGIAAKLAGVPLLVRTRHLNIPLKRSILNFVHYLPDFYITCGENMRDNLIYNCGFPSEKVVSIPTGVGQRFFDVSRDKDNAAKHGLSSCCPIITNVGILRSVKGHEITFQSVKSVINTFPDAKFLIVGDGPARARLEDLVDSLGIRKSVVFAGFLNDIHEIYSFSDVVVLSSWSEGLPQSLLQAMAAGVPVVATRVGGVPEVIIPEKTGLLVEPGDHEGLAGSIIRILQDSDLKERMVNEAKELVQSGYTESIMLDKIESLYSTFSRR